MKNFLLFAACICICQLKAQRKEIGGDSVVMPQEVKNVLHAEFNRDLLVVRTKEYRNIEDLPEVLIYKNNEINAVALGIIPNEIKKLTLNEKRLKTAGDFKAIHLLSLLGGSLEVDPIINAITGRTKKLKKIVAVERKVLNVAFLNENYSDYIFENLPITEIDFGKFLYFMADDPTCIEIVETKEHTVIELFISEHWARFKAENYRF